MSSPRQFNSPAQMLARLAYVLHLALGLWGFAVGMGATLGGEHRLLPQAVVLLALSASLFWTLHKSNRLVECRRSLDNVFGVSDSADDAQLTALLERRSVIEDLRGTPSFDPWELLALQHEIKEHLRAHPELQSSGQG